MQLLDGEPAAIARACESEVVLCPHGVAYAADAGDVGTGEFCLLKLEGLADGS